MGYKNVLDSTSIVGVNEKIIEMQASRRKEVFQNNEELIQISELYESKKVIFILLIKPFLYFANHEKASSMAC